MSKPTTRPQLATTTRTGASLYHENMLMQRIELLQNQKKVYQFSTFLSEEVLKIHGSEQFMNDIHYFVGALLSIEITGINQMIERHNMFGHGELYKTNIGLNSYIGSMIEVVRFYGGDVLSVMSAGFIGLWKIPPEESMHEILHTVVVCGNIILKLLGSYDTQVNVVLQPKVAISCGNISLAVLKESRMNVAIFFGNAFDSLRQCISFAMEGQLLVTGSAWPHLQQDRYKVEKVAEKYVKILRISYRSNEAYLKEQFDEWFITVIDLLEKHKRHYDLLATLILSTQMMTSSNTLSNFVKQLPPRQESKIAPHFWTIESIRPFVHLVIYQQIIQNQPVEYLNQLREITTMQITIILKPMNIPTMVDTFTSILTVIVDYDHRFNATVNTLIASSSEIKINVVFGLIYVNSENESFNALNYAQKVKYTLEDMTNIGHVSVGISSGIVYCTVIGHPLRREYVVIGKPIERAASLSMWYKGKVTCDYKIFNSSNMSSVYFLLLVNPEYPLNEYVFEYNEKFDETETWPELKTLVDRVTEYNLLVKMIQTPMKVGFTCVCLNGRAMVGKSTLLMHVRDAAQRNDYNVILVELKDFSAYPFSLIVDLYARIYDITYMNLGQVPVFPRLPRRIHAFDPETDLESDIVVAKYRFFMKFRNIMRIILRTLVIIIDNIESIDAQSWEVMELTFPATNVRLIMAGNLDLSTFHLKVLMETRTSIRLIELQPLKREFVRHLACTFMETQAISKELVHLLEKASGGVPGIVASALLRMIKKDEIELRLIKVNRIDREHFYVNNEEYLKKIETMIPVVEFKGNSRQDIAELTMANIYKDLFDSLSSFQQIVVKTASVIGMSVPRNILVAALNYPSEPEFTACIKSLFEEDIFECGARYLAVGRIKSRKIRCCCYFSKSAVLDFYNSVGKEIWLTTKYAYCKFVYFKSKEFREIAYARIPDSQRHELHVVCSELLERMDHICPNCSRSPAEYFVTFGKYKHFMEFCADHKNFTYNYHRIHEDSGNDVKETLYKLKQNKLIYNEIISRQGVSPTNKMQRTYDLGACQCMQMLHSTYHDIIYHATKAHEFGKVIFYTLKLGLVKLCMLDVNGAIVTLTEARNLSLSQTCLKEFESTAYFRQYHIGTASIALAMCYMRLKEYRAAKRDIMVALRQYNIPTLIFSYKHLKFLLRRNYMRLLTLKRNPRKDSPYAWELGVSLFICAKLFAREKKWIYARDCCQFSLALMTSVNPNIPILFDVYSDAVEIYRKTGDNETCVRLQTYLLREYQAKFASNTFYFHTLYDLVDVLVDVLVIKGMLKEAIRLSYRLLHIVSFANVSALDPTVLLHLCELTMHTLYIRDFVDIMALLLRNLKSSHKYGYFYYYFMALYFYVYTGFTVVDFKEIVIYAKHTILKSDSLSSNMLTFKALMQLEYARRGQIENSNNWEVNYNYMHARLSDYRVVRAMLAQMECYLLMKADHVHFSKSYNKSVTRDIDLLLKLLHSSTGYNLMYKPAFLILQAWYRWLCGRPLGALEGLQNAKLMAKKHNNWYCVALAQRLRHFWTGGTMIDYNKRPIVSVKDGASYTFEQFTNFLHPYILKP